MAPYLIPAWRDKARSKLNGRDCCPWTWSDDVMLTGEGVDWIGTPGENNEVIVELL